MNADNTFRTTRWTRVMLASGDSEESKSALSELCEIYYRPVHAFIRHAGNADDADDLTQAFFAKLLQNAGLNGIDPQRGRFRTYLLGAVKHFVRDERVKSQAEKRGGSSETLAGDEVDFGLMEPAPSDAVFDREWAMALIERAIGKVKAHTSGEQFKVLKPWLNGSFADLSQAEAAAELGVGEGSVKVAIHRLRKRFRQCVREEIVQTVSGEDEISAELNYLIEVLASGEV